MCHILRFPNQFTVRLGTTRTYIDDQDTVISSVDRVFHHPLFNYSTLLNDVGLLRLSQPVDFTDVIRPICLPSPAVDTDAFRVCVSTGFGMTSYPGKSITKSLVLLWHRP